MDEHLEEVSGFLRSGWPPCCFWMCDQAPELGQTLTCAGNRRSEHSKIRSVSGVQWGRGAIGNARWSGFRLSDVLEAAGLRDQASHVCSRVLIRFCEIAPPFRSQDPSRCNGRWTYSPGSSGGEMNGAPLEPDHGFPLRSLAPGVIGARSVKWLGRIVVSDRPSANHYVRRAYKLVKTGEEDEWDQAQPIQEFPLNSAICFPEENAAVEAGTLIVRGYALAAGDFDIFVDRAELSVDQGENWTMAEWTSESRRFAGDSGGDRSPSTPVRDQSSFVRLIPGDWSSPPPSNGTSRDTSSTPGIGFPFGLFERSLTKYVLWLPVICLDGSGPQLPPNIELDSSHKSARQSRTDTSRSSGHNVGPVGKVLYRYKSVTACFSAFRSYSADRPNIM